MKTLFLATLYTFSCGFAFAQQDDEAFIQSENIDLYFASKKAYGPHVEGYINFDPSNTFFDSTTMVWLPASLYQQPMQQGTYWATFEVTGDDLGTDYNWLVKELFAYLKDPNLKPGSVYNIPPNLENYHGLRSLEVAPVRAVGTVSVLMNPEDDPDGFGDFYGADYQDVKYPEVADIGMKTVLHPFAFPLTTAEANALSEATDTIYTENPELNVEYVKWCTPKNLNSLWVTVEMNYNYSKLEMETSILSVSLNFMPAAGYPYGRECVLINYANFIADPARAKHNANALMKDQILSNDYIQEYALVGGDWDFNPFMQVQSHWMRDCWMIDMNINELTAFTYQQYDDNGDPFNFVTTSVPMRNGKPNGHYKRMHYAGLAEHEGDFVNGKMTGLWVGYNHDGYLNYKLNYKDNQLEGLQQFFSGFGEEARPTHEFTIEKGLLNGEWKRHYYTGKLMESGTYKKGKKVGEWTYGNESGTTVVKVTY